VEELRLRLAEAEEALRAIRSGEVDSLLVEGPGGPLVYALERGHNHHRTLVEAMIGEGAATVAADGTVLYCNGRLAELAGLPLERVMGASLATLVSPDGYGRLDVLLAKGRAGSARGEFVVRRPDGSEVEVQLSVRALDETPVLSLVAIDLTERRHSEAAEMANRDLLARILATSSDAIWACDVNGHLRFANARAGQLFDFDPAAAVGQRAVEVLPAGLRTEVEEVVRLAASGGPVHRDFVLASERGPSRHLVVSADQLRDGGGAPAGVVAAFADVTEFRQTLDQLHEAQKLEAIGRLAGGVAHDFNNLLVILMSSVELLANNPTVARDEGARADLSALREATERARSLTRQLLAFGRRQVAQPALIDLGPTLDRIERLLRRLLTEDIELGIRVAADIWPILADPVQLEQVLLNLLVNARDAMPAGGTITLDASNLELTAESAKAYPGSRPGPYVRIKVRDPGVGMPPEVLEHAFEPFFTTKPVGQGTGLGLATVHGIVQQNGGVVRAKSQVDRGTTIEVLLPRHVPAQATRASTAPLPAPPGAAPSNRVEAELVLVVEDEPLVRAATTRALRDAGFQVMEACCGKEALALLLRVAGGVHLVVTDAVMPGMNGRELNAAIQGLWPGLRVLLVSGHAHEVLQKRRLVDEALAFLEKPFTPTELVGKVRAVIDDRQEAGLNILRGTADSAVEQGHQANCHGPSRSSRSPSVTASPGERGPIGSRRAAPGER
jgi:PAS domain S-box-containing protein